MLFRSKYANNAFLATKISFINTLANICNKIPGGDIEIIAKAIGYDPRIGALFLKAGPGYGGSCLPKDLSTFLNFCRSIGYNPVLLESTQIANKKQALVVVRMIENRVKDLKNRLITVLGLSFKEGTDDVRDAVSIKIVEMLLKKGAKVNVHDPIALENFKRIFKNKVCYCESAKECIKNAECCVILTGWDEYKLLTPEDFKKHMKYARVVDTRRIFDPAAMSSIDYLAIGYGKL